MSYLALLCPVQLLGYSDPGIVRSELVGIKWVMVKLNNILLSFSCPRNGDLNGWLFDRLREGRVFVEVPIPRRGLAYERLATLREDEYSRQTDEVKNFLICLLSVPIGFLDDLKRVLIDDLLV